ncbi:MAG: hypothetical protein FWG90_10810 [Oscillospiraceae bacterium]|nr:hypothetical protein [Oscillospiraceae bacterium]
MQVYPAYYENGRIIPVGNPVIPDGCSLIITVLDDVINSIKEAKGENKVKTAKSGHFPYFPVDMGEYSFNREEANER